jgi:predicted HTH transcriptional regulator
MKNWINKAVAYLDKSLGKVPSELNEIDWKEALSPKNDKLCQHIFAFANMPGGGFLVFGIDNKTANIVGIDKTKADNIIERLASLCRDGVNPLVKIDHSIETFRGKELLFVYIQESAIKPVHLIHKTIEDSFIRSGGTTRKASRQEVGALMLNSKSPTWEELHASKLLTELEVITLLEYDKILELLGKPVPSKIEEMKFEELENSFVVSMFAPMKYADMTNDERIEACYQHSIIEYYGGGCFYNTSLRKRFGMHEKQASQISLLIKEAMDAGKIKPKDPENVSKKFSLYVPYWA